MAPQLAAVSPACVSVTSGHFSALGLLMPHCLFFSVFPPNTLFSFDLNLAYPSRTCPACHCTCLPVPSAPSSFFSSHGTNGLTRVLQLLNVSIHSGLGLARNVGGDVPYPEET